MTTSGTWPKTVTLPVIRRSWIVLSRANSKFHLRRLAFVDDGRDAVSRASPASLPAVSIASRASSLAEIALNDTRHCPGASRCAQ